MRPNPPNGSRQTLQRGADGKRRFSQRNLETSPFSQYHGEEVAVVALSATAIQCWDRVVLGKANAQDQEDEKQEDGETRHNDRHEPIMFDVRPRSRHDRAPAMQV